MTIAAEPVRKQNLLCVVRMKKLDLVKINSYAPYVVKEDTQEGAYTFIADSGA